MADRNGNKFTAREVVTADPSPIGSMPCVAELERWRSHADADHFPYRSVLDEFRRHGKHFVHADLLRALVAVRAALAGVAGSGPGREQLARFLDAALDKHDGRYDYTSYLAIDLLELPGESDSGLAAEPAQARRDRLFVLLVNDLLRFESGIQDGALTILPQLRPDAATVASRYRWGLRAIRLPLGRLGIDAGPDDREPAAAVRDLCARLGRDESAAERRLLEITMLPVYVAHDEYLFLRVLQSFELTFAWIAVYIRTALAAFEHDPREVVRQVNLAQTMLKEASKLFPLLATMQREAFQTFRQFTEGASAIQSRNYKTVESLCRLPDAARLNSIAYESVPEVRQKLLANPPTLDDAFRRVLHSGTYGAADRERIRGALSRFSAMLLRWKRTHYGIAVQMLGEKTGTGYTEGTPYLRRVCDIPVFTSLDHDGR